MTKLTVSLTRAHKIADRIGAEMNTAKTQTTTTNAQARMSTAPTKEQAAVLRDAAAAALAAANRFVALARAQQGIREVIAQANVAAGVSAILAKIEANKKVIAMYAAMASAYEVSADQVHVDALEDYVWSQSTNAYSPGVQVTAMTRNAVADINAAKQELERENMSLNDQLPDLNARSVSIEIADDLAYSLGL